MDALQIKTHARTPRTKKKNFNTYKSFIYKVLKQVSPLSGISTKAMNVMDPLVHDLFEQLATESGRLARYNKKATITSREVQSAVRLIFPGELAKHAVSEGTKAVTKFNIAEAASGTRSSRAGLLFPVGRIHAQLKKGRFAARLSNTAPIFLAAILEYVVAEVLEIASKVAMDSKKYRVIPRHILLAIKNDDELEKLFAHAQICRGGIVPHIHTAILPRRHQKELVSAQKTY